MNHNKIVIINPLPLIESLKNNSEKKEQFTQLNQEDFYLKHFTVEPPEGYILPINTETDELFPNCCKRHQEMVITINDWYENFPDCCDIHRKLIGEPWFNKSEYEYVKEKIPSQISYIEFFIETNINNDEWYNLITEYLDLHLQSFGQFPKGKGIAGIDPFLSILKDYFETHEEIISKDKANSLLKFIDNYFPTEKGSSSVDLNRLLEIYKRWLETFPFDIVYFRNLKNSFAEQLPILHGTAINNRFLNTSKIKIYNEPDFINYLCDLTHDLISQVNPKELLQSGIIKKIEVHKMDIANETYRIGTLQLVKQYHRKELRYVNTLSKWLKLNKEYFKDIAPNFKEISSTPMELISETNNELNKTLLTIQQLINEIDTKKGWRYAFNSKEDYTKFCQLLQFYFENGGYNIPEYHISLNKRSMTRFATILKHIHYNLGKGNLKSDSVYFDVIRVLNSFKDKTNDQIYKLITG